MTKFPRCWNILLLRGIEEGGFCLPAKSAARNEVWVLRPPPTVRQAICYMLKFFEHKTYLKTNMPDV